MKATSNEKKIAMTFELPVELKQQAYDAAVLEDRSLSAWIREQIRKGVEEINERAG